MLLRAYPAACFYRPRQLNFSVNQNSHRQPREVIANRVRATVSMAAITKMDKDENCEGLINAFSSLSLSGYSNLLFGRLNCGDNKTMSIHFHSLIILPITLIKA